MVKEKTPPQIIEHKDDYWIVLSSDGKTKYKVTLEPISCECKYFTGHYKRMECKHIILVRNSQVTEEEKKPIKTEQYSLDDLDDMLDG